MGVFALPRVSCLLVNKKRERNKLLHEKGIWEEKGAQVLLDLFMRSKAMPLALLLIRILFFPVKLRRNFDKRIMCSLLRLR